MGVGMRRSSSMRVIGGKYIGQIMEDCEEEGGVKHEPKEELEEEIPDQDPDPGVYERSLLPQYLKVYYKWLFPYDKYFEWLQYGNLQEFSRREFSFTLEDDVYVRFQSFDNKEALKEGIQKSNPYKIDIGPIYSVKPSMRNRVQQSNFKPVCKELVFDIDMTDYDDIRTCCQEANICIKCWKFVTIAIRVVDRALRDDFGFKHLLWVYSGRRGVHCWVCDREAIDLSPEARLAIVEYLTLVRGGDQQTQKVKLKTPIHPSIQSSVKIIDHYFGALLEEQEFFATHKQWSKLLALLPHATAKELDREWEEEVGMSSSDKWSRVQQEVTNKTTLQEIKLQWSYPRLDVNVSKGVNHLLKSPLCVHPKTGRVCVPIDLKNLDAFDPFSVPTVAQICHEFECHKPVKQESPQKLGVPDYKKTSLNSYMKVFEAFLNPLRKEIGARKAKQKSMDY